MNPASNLPVAGIASSVDPASIAALNMEHYTTSGYKSGNPDTAGDFKNGDNDIPDILDTGSSTSIDSGNHERVSIPTLREKSGLRSSDQMKSSHSKASHLLGQSTPNIPNSLVSCLNNKTQHPFYWRLI